MTRARFDVVRALVAIGALASIAHFADNATSTSRYPEPSWITPVGVWVAWIPIGALCAYLLLTHRRDRPFRIGVVVLGVVLLAGLLHFTYGSMRMMSPISTATILGEAATGVALLGALFRASRSSQLR